MKKGLCKGFLGVVLMLFLVSLAGCGGSSPEKKEEGKEKPAAQTVTLKLAHQWPAPVDNKGDYRSRLAVKFAEEVARKSNGTLKIEVYPANSLLKPNQQFDAMRKGSLDMAIWAPFYEAGKVPEFSITLMPGVIKSHDKAWEWMNNEIGKELEKLFAKNDVKLLVWTWEVCSIASKNKKVASLEDVKGLKIRGAGKDSEKLFKDLGAGIASMPSSEIYTAMQTGVIDAVITSYSSFDSFRLYELVKYFYYPEKTEPWLYAMMPLVMSTKTWERLSPEHQKALLEVAKELQPWVIEQTKKDNERIADLFRQHGVEVYDISKEQSQKWFAACQPVVDEFAKVSEEAKKLVELARKVN